MAGAWPGMPRITRRTSTGTSTREGRLKKEYPFPMNKNGNLVSADEEKAEVLNFFCLSLHWQTFFSPLPS